MPACPQCASEVEESAAACIHCGAALSSPQHVVALESQPIELASAERVPFSTPMFAPERDLEGIGGWLILMMLGLVFSPFIILFSTLSTHLPFLTGEQYRPFFESHPAFHAVIIFEVVTNLIVVLFLVALNYLFFKKKRGFPTYMILCLVFQLILQIADTAVVHALLPSAPVTDAARQGIERAVIGAAIWIPYLILSRRVKVTFVH